MAGDETTATEPRPKEYSQEEEKVQAKDHSQEEEKVLAKDVTGSEQIERGTDQHIARQLPRPPSQAPLPPSHLETRKNQPLPPPPPQGVHFGPLPYNNAFNGPDGASVDFERPFHPRWHKTKLALLSLSLIVSAVIFGMAIAICLFNAPYYLQVSGPGPAEIELSTSGSAAGLAVLVTAGEFLTTLLSRRREGLPAGSLVAFHLLIWLLALVAVVVSAIYATDSHAWYNYSRSDRIVLLSQQQVYQQVLLAFDCILLAIHFVLFVGACVETSRAERAKKTVFVQVPVPVDGTYPAGPYPAGFDPRRSFVPPPGWQPGQYPAPLMTQMPQHAGGGTDPAHPPPAVVYGGYYAPPPHNAAWAASHQQQGNATSQGYYAPAPAPDLPPRRASNSAPNSRREPLAPALASSSGSRRSQRLSQSHQAAAPPPEPQGQANAGEQSPERNA
ncbi:hypothetical protein N658DRAFT_479306 [Parathielavia hyrcaniae]|uniref:Uncharacterized protein n=1 Tax=Parathielavia hyrcaniae TaxID=113614 RepID=A0AAN6SY82_9PEZI|nr:hypothetical protein N658DRAFT_479306 [Parathielavia hyrcaniae]